MKEKEKGEEIKFEKALEELKGIVEKLEKGDMELEASLGLFERGVKLMGICQGKLEDAERRVEAVSKGIDGKRTVKPFEEGGDWEEEGGK
jgi:exodeoxyribonuclease VII small subunit